MMPIPFPLGNANETLAGNVRMTVDRPYPGSEAVIRGLESAPGNFMCLASMTSSHVGNPDCGSLPLPCWFVHNPNRSVRELVLEALSQINWEELAEESPII